MSDLLPLGTIGRKPAKVLPAEIPGVNRLLTVVVSVVVVAALYLGREVLIPITLAVLLSFLLAPRQPLLIVADSIVFHSMSSARISPIPF